MRIDLNGQHLTTAARTLADLLIEQGVNAGSVAGLRPAFADNLPALHQQDGRIHLNGLYRHGFLMAPALVADLVTHLQKETADAH